MNKLPSELKILANKEQTATYEWAWHNNDY